MRHIGRARLSSIADPLPPVEEQRRIVDLLEDHLSRLDAADAYLTIARRRLSALVQQCFDGLLGGRTSRCTLGATTFRRSRLGRRERVAEGPNGASSRSRHDVRQIRWLETRVQLTQPIRAFEIRGGDLLVKRANIDLDVAASVHVAGPPQVASSDKSLRVYVPKTCFVSDAVGAHFMHRTPRAQIRRWSIWHQGVR